MESRIPEIALALSAAVDAALEEGAKLVAEAAKNRVPVESGRLRDAIHTEVDPEAGGVAVVAGDRKVFYGHMVEHGTVNAPPHPFLLPALEENRATIIGMVRTAVRRAVE